MDKGGGEEGEGEMNGESSMDAYTLTYVNRQPMGIHCMTQELKLGLRNNLEGWEWVGGGREIQEGGDICIHMVISC